MADLIQQFEELATKLENRELPTAAPATAPVDVCAIWKTLKPFIDIGIKLLRLLPLAWAKKLCGCHSSYSKTL